MNDRRFVELLNESAASFSGIWDVAAAQRRDPASVSAWAGFLAACVERGVLIGDERWREVEVRVRGGKPVFALPSLRPSAKPLIENDFSVGLTLLMGLLNRGSKDPPER